MNNQFEAPQGGDVYWAAGDPRSLASDCMRAVNSFYLFITRYGILDKWKRAYLAYYGMSESGTDTSKLNQGGLNGELYLVKVNHFRSLLTNLLTLTTSQRPALQPKAQNTDAKSLNQTVLARSIIDFYMTEKRLEVKLKKATEFALMAGEVHLLILFFCLSERYVQSLLSYVALSGVLTRSLGII